MRSAGISPVLASSIAFLVRASASPSKSASSANVVAFREPRGRPSGLPDSPGLNLVSCFLPVLSDLLIAFLHANLRGAPHLSSPAKRTAPELFGRRKLWPAPDTHWIAANCSVSAETVPPRSIGISPITSNRLAGATGCTPNKSSVVQPSRSAAAAHVVRKLSASAIISRHRPEDAQD